MPDAASTQARSRWGINSVHLPSLSVAPTDEHFNLHLAAVEYELSAAIIIESEEDILSRKHWSGRLEPYRHQIQNLLTFCNRAPVALFADDVGLGKTISAGLVLNELQTRRKVRRALILCPKMLLDQWKEELNEKFGIAAEFGVGAGLDPYLHHSVPVVLTTYETARDRMDRIRTASFDMVILDEAHKLRNLHGAAQPPRLAKVIYDSLVDRHFKYVLMLTATPIQNRLWDIYSLVDCLSKARGHKNPFGSAEEFSVMYLADNAATARTLRPGMRSDFRRKLQEYMVRTSRRDANLAFPERRVLPIQCQASPQEKSLQALVGAVIGNLNHLTRISLAEALMSSPKALIAQVRQMNSNGTLSIRVLQQFERAVQQSGNGCKMEKLLGVLSGLLSTNPKSWRAIVFTRRVETLGLICEKLQERDIRTAAVHGSRGAANQAAIAAFTADPPRANVLVSTDAGAVGLNLQACNVVINYDLPWNPMVLEQRIGRVQRLGSRFKYIEVLNLTVKDSIEDHIVARLLSKLQVISATVGHIEAILEATESDDKEFEERLSDLVMRALMGQDVEAAARRAQESIDSAKEIYEREWAQVEQTLGGLDEMHRAGPRVPKIKPTPPRLDVPTFCLNAFVCDGAQIQELPHGQIRVALRGRTAWTATFDPDDPDLNMAGRGIFGGPTLKLYAEGSPAFEGLLGEWRKRHSLRVWDRVKESRQRIRSVLQGWVESMGIGLQLEGFVIRRENPSFNGILEIRASASVSHDRFEKICSTEYFPKEHGTLPQPSDPCELVDHQAISDVMPTARKSIIETVEGDSDIREFIRFYEARKAEEVLRAGGSGAARDEVSRRFETSLSAELIGAMGSRYVTVEVYATFTDQDQRESFVASLHIVPLNGKVLSEPERSRCESCKKSVPIEWLGECLISHQKVLRNLLATSELSGKTALPQFFGSCEITNRRLLLGELGTSEVSGKRVAWDLLRKSEISGRQALACELMRCEVSGLAALPDELLRSAISGKMVRSDQMIGSQKTGIRGHRSEFRVCEETNVVIAPNEGSKSDVSGRFVCKELLIASEKNPERYGLQSERVKCSVSSRWLLVDEAEKSVVSGRWIDKAEVAYSGVSSRPARRDEVLKCSISGLTLLPDEIGKSDVSGRMVDARRLLKSQITGKLALKEEMRTCGFTGAQILANEAIKSEVSGKFVRFDQVVSSAISNIKGHTSEFVQCVVSKDWLLPHEAGKSDMSAMTVRPELLRCSEKAPGRKGIDAEFEICELTGKILLRDEVARSEASGRLVDRDLLVASTVSGRCAIEHELETCEETGARVLPDESEVCSVTGKRVVRNLIGTSDLSGKRGLSRLLYVCPETGKSGFIAEMAICSATKMRVAPTALTVCSVTGESVLSRLTIQCACSGRWLLKENAQVSEKTGRLGHPDVMRLCTWTGRRLLLDETKQCQITGLVFDGDLVPTSAPAQPLIELFQLGIPDGIASDPDTQRLRNALAKVGVKARALATQYSAYRKVVAYFADCSGLFGLKKRYSVGFAMNDEEYLLLHTPCDGHLVNDSWVRGN